MEEPKAPNGGDTEQQVSKYWVLSIVRMLWKRRWLTASIWATVSLGTVALVRMMPSLYRAEAVVLVDSQKIPESFVSPTVNGDVADRLALISQSIMTSASLTEIINSFQLYRTERSRLSQQELLRKMRQDITVSFEKSWTGGRMKSFRIGYQGHDPRLIAEVANRLAGLYVAENMRSREDQAEDTVNFLRRQLEQAKVSLDEQEQKVARFKEEHNGTLPEQQNSLLGTLSSLSIELQGVQASIARTQENKLSLEASLSAAESSQASTKASLQHEVKGTDGRTLRPKSAILTEKLHELSSRYMPDHPEMQALQSEIAQARREESDASAAGLDSNDTPSRGQATSAAEQRNLLLSPELVQFRERISTLKAQIEVSNHQIESLEKQREQLTVALSDCQARINRLPLVEQEMSGLKRNYDESASNYNSLLQKKLAAGVATDMERSHRSERFTVIDPAVPPQKPESPKRAVIVLAGSVVGLIIGVLVSFVWEFRKQTLLGEWELPAGTAVLGRVPPISIPASTPTRPRPFTASLLCLAVLIHLLRFARV
jgi:polysaccharide biosynthesis transport protein